MDSARELEAIRSLKYAYFRTLDLKQFDELGALLTEDATASYEDGKTVLEGRAAIVSWLREALADPGIISEHHGHHPELTLVSEHEATGTWYLQDRVIVPAADFELGGTAFYEDRYRLTGEGWRIAHTGYTRVFEEQRTHSTLAVRSFTSRFDRAGLNVKPGSNRVAGASAFSTASTKSGSRSMSSALTFS